MARGRAQLMGVVIMVTKLWGNGLHITLKEVPEVREGSGAARVDWKSWTPKPNRLSEKACPWKAWSVNPC